MLIKVTQEDIDAGKRGHCFKCPIALAASRALGKSEVQAGPNFIVYEKDSSLELVMYRTPMEAKFFMQQFDANKTVKPFEFELTDPV